MTCAKVAEKRPGNCENFLRLRRADDGLLVREK
jgi:hypothetical protein